MSRNLAISLLLSLLWSVIAAAQSDWRTPTNASIRNYPDTTSLFQEVEWLADSLRQGRKRMGKGHGDTAFYLAHKMKVLGCSEVNGGYVQGFQVGDSTDLGHNILGIMHCGPKTNNKYIIVGAHYDGLGTIKGRVYPGADANASGVAAMLEIASTFSKQIKYGYRYNADIIFVAFDAYTDGRSGSKALWRAIAGGKLYDSVRGRKIKPENISLMIDLDQIGSTMAPVNPQRKDYLIAIGEHSLRNPSDRTVLEKCNDFYDTKLDLCKTYYGSVNFTDAFYKLGDRKHFIRGGIPTMYFTSGITPSTNKPSDDANSLDYEVLRRRTILIFRFIEKMMQ